MHRTYFLKALTYYYINIYNSSKYMSTLKWKTILLRYIKCPTCCYINRIHLLENTLSCSYLRPLDLKSLIHLSYILTSVQQGKKGLCQPQRQSQFSNFSFTSLYLLNIPQRSILSQKMNTCNYLYLCSYPCHSEHVMCFRLQL